ncbi:hypothetical protein GT23_1166 [Parageobacillus thermoglucosidasius]|nr:hypothetical protein GT23_1166 [Parageobacillus thermoglucosidasius]
MNFQTITTFVEKFFKTKQILLKMMKKTASLPNASAASARQKAGDCVRDSLFS